MKAHAYFFGGMDAVIQFAAIRVDVEMVTGGCATRKYQLRHGRLRRY